MKKVIIITGIIMAISSFTMAKDNNIKGERVGSKVALDVSVEDVIEADMRMSGYDDDVTYEIVSYPRVDYVAYRTYNADGKPTGYTHYIPRGGLYVAYSPNSIVG